MEAQEETEEEDEITSVVPLRPQETQPSDSYNACSLAETSSPKTHQNRQTIQWATDSSEL